MSANRFVVEQVEIFRTIQPRFEDLHRILMATLERASKHLPGVLFVQGRVKAVPSFAEKCLRKQHKYRQPAWQLTDLCGVRIIVAARDQIAPVRRFIEEHFEIDENEDTAQRLREMEFGYQSVHYIVSLKRAELALYQAAGLNVPDELFRWRHEDEAGASGLPVGPVFKAEIQVRTLLQHAWALLIHDNLYKTEMKKKPFHLVRQSGLIAALLEDADEHFRGFLKGIENYRSYYGAYMSNKEILAEIEVQKAILAQDPDNESIALKIARLVYNLDNDAEAPLAETVLAPFEKLDSADIHRELGLVRWKSEERKRKARGRASLVKATELNPGDPDNWCELGRTYFEEHDYWNALESYQRAFDIAPEYPRALLRYIECRIMSSGDFSFIPLIRHNLEKAVEASQQKIDAGMHIPWAWYDIGFFELLLGRPYRSLDAYGKGILKTASAAMVEAVYRSLTEIHKKAHGAQPQLAEHLNWVRSFLKVVLVGRCGKSADEFLCAAEPRLDGFKSLTVCAGPDSPPPFQPKEAVRIVAGACARTSERLIAVYERLVRDGFDGFQGVVCSGGTAAGISRVVGDLPNPEGWIRKLAYLPSGHPAEDAEHPAYTPPIRTTRGTYSPLDPVMLWSDLLACGVNPGDVRLLGISGGELAGFECRLALLLKAKVGVLPESGRAALEIAMDEAWNEGCKGDLLRLPTDRETVRAFVQPPQPSGMLEAVREKIAKDTHERFRSQAVPSLMKEHRELAPWEELEETFKKANLDQVDHIEDKLRRVELGVRPAESGSPERYEFRADQVELLAEMEHGRWVVERLIDGWTYGEIRDNEKKTRPQLVPWADLPPGEKEKDRRAVKDIPNKLAARGYEICVP